MEVLLGIEVLGRVGACDVASWGALGRSTITYESDFGSYLDQWDRCGSLNDGVGYGKFVGEREKRYLVFFFFSCLKIEIENFGDL